MTPVPSWTAAETVATRRIAGTSRFAIKKSRRARTAMKRAPYQKRPSRTADRGNRQRRSVRNQVSCCTGPPERGVRADNTHLGDGSHLHRTDMPPNPINAKVSLDRHCSTAHGPSSLLLSAPLVGARIHLGVDLDAPALPGHAVHSAQISEGGRAIRSRGTTVCHHRGWYQGTAPVPGFVR